MTASLAGTGGIEFDYDATFGLTRLERRPFAIQVVDGDGNAQDDVSAWTFNFFVLKRLSDADGLTALTAAALVHKDDGAMTKSGSTAEFTLDAVDEDWPSASGRYAYEFWGDDGDGPNRIAWGVFIVNP